MPVVQRRQLVVGRPPDFEIVFVDHGVEEEARSSLPPHVRDNLSISPFGGVVAAHVAHLDVVVWVVAYVEGGWRCHRCRIRDEAWLWRRQCLGKLGKGIGAS